MKSVLHTRETLEPPAGTSLEHPIAFIGASTSNLYGARIAQKRGHAVIVFERKPNLRNDTIRQLPEPLLTRFDYPIAPYVRLTDLKKHLAQDLEVEFETACDVKDGILFVNDEPYETRAIIMNTGQKDIEIEGVHTYSYATDKQYAGASLEDACDKVERIIEEIE